MLLQEQKDSDVVQEELQLVKTYWRLTNFLGASQLYLKDNFLLKESLKPEHIKDRLLGHWGTVPGINFIYAHLNRLIRKYDLNTLLITGPGHGAPANLANLYLEGSLQEYFPEYTHTYEGLSKFIKNFSWPGGFPSHLYPGIPGTILEGGELGYALSTAFGAVLDNPDLLVACIVGDGEAETGPTAGAWHAPKFLDPAESGAVLPILHLNGYKISNPTIYGTMDSEELTLLFQGYGYQPRIVSHENDIHIEMFNALEWAYQEIKKIQRAARAQQPIFKPHWPLIILKSLKGWTGIKEIDGLPIEGSYRSHQIPAKDLKTNRKHLELVETWLLSYQPHELFNNEGSPRREILKNCPEGKRRMGCNPHVYGGEIVSELQRPQLEKYEISFSKKGEEKKNVAAFGNYLKEIVSLNPHSFRIFSPDELESNQLQAVFEVTARDYQWPVHPFDSNQTKMDGRVTEVLSEHLCEGLLQGYLLTGRHGLFPSYESFLNIISSMMGQYAKFLKFCRETNWRKPFASLNYLETSTLWRQEHNGFSHQNPGLINTLLNLKPNIVRIYLPPDANCLISTMDHCFQSKGYINLVIANKNEMPQWLTMKEAVDHCRAGASVWKWASIDEGVNPDVVLTGIGDSTHIEVMAAAYILRHELPELKVRVVNVTDLLILEKETIHPHGLDDELFEALFTKDRPIIINFHGYPSVIKQLLFGRMLSNRMVIHGYLEEGTTTTPFDMHVRNKTSRFHLIMDAIRLAVPFNAKVAAKANEWVSHYEYVLIQHREYIKTHGKDPDVIDHWRWEK